MKHVETFPDMIARLYPPKQKLGDNRRIISQTVTFQVTDACNLACTYCYQINKGKRRMSFETAKKFIDLLLSGDKGVDKYLSPEYSPAVIIEFIGGEPFMEIELIEKICDYFVEETTRLDHPWQNKFCFSICSNGTLYFKPEVQRFLKKYEKLLSFSITIDGNRELHDSCRVFHDGSPSYDIAVAGAKDWMNRGCYMGSKITLSPYNIQHTYNALVNIINLQYKEIYCNCVYEEGWTLDHAKILYSEMKKVADYLLDNDLDNDVYISLFEEDDFRPQLPVENDNWCGGTGMMLALDPDGWIYPCLRYMESSLGKDQPPIRIGNIDIGIGSNKEHSSCISCLKCITRRSQSTDECFYCPIAKGCSWCSAHNYQVFGTPDKRATYICIMHKARSLANVYFWNKYYIKNNIKKRKKMFCYEDWAIDIIGVDEYNTLKYLSERTE